MSTLSDIKDELRQKFQVLSKGYVVTAVIHEYASMFEDEEQGLIDTAVKDLIAEGVVNEKLEIL